MILLLSLMIFITLKSFVNFRSLMILPTLVSRTKPLTLLLSKKISNGMIDTASIRNQDPKYYLAISLLLSIKTYLASRYAVLKIKNISIKKKKSMKRSIIYQTMCFLSVKAILNGVAKHEKINTNVMNRSQAIFSLSSGYNMQGLRFILGVLYKVNLAL